METGAIVERETRQLRRLETLIDVVYALAIVRLFTHLPLPSKAEWTWGSVAHFLDENVGLFATLFIGIILISIYWIQNNTLFGNLVRTDNRHAVISIFQLSFLLLYLYSVGLGIDFQGDRVALAMQSVTLALVGFSSVAAWHHARKNRLLISDEISDDDAREIHGRIMVEPVSAMITLPCAFISPIVWELAWLVYPATLLVIRKVKAPKP
jgi:uncharacterized membrane protein